MNFAKLIEPYSDGGNRTIEGQINWLLKKNLSAEVIEGAVAIVYLELDMGRKFKNGHELDRYLLEVANQIAKEQIASMIKSARKTAESGGMTDLKIRNNINHRLLGIKNQKRRSWFIRFLNHKIF